MVNSESSRHFLRWRYLLILLVGTGGFLVGASPVGAATPCDSETVVPDQESSLRLACDVLWAFLSGLDDPGVLDDEDNPKAWGMNNPVSEWQGTRWSNDRLTALQLTSGGLSGPISPRLGELTDLSALDFSSNELTGSIPPELGRLSNLATLLLHSNQLVGSLPAELGRLSKLLVLTVHMNRLSGSLPMELGALSNLIQLSLHTNQFSGPIPKEMGSLSELEFLELGGNRFTGSLPSEFGNLTKLTYLVIHSSDLTGPLPPELGQLTQLRHMHFFSNKFTGPIPSDFGQLVNLEVLDLSNNQLEGSIPVELGNLSNLTRLSLQNNRLTGGIPTELSRLTNLVILELEGNQVFYYDSQFEPQDDSAQSEQAGSEGDGSESESEREGPFAGDPLGLIAHTEWYRDRTLGSQTWELWFCDLPLGDTTVNQKQVERTLNSVITKYFRWLSGGKYIPDFRVTGEFQAEDLNGCTSAAREQSPEALLAVVTDAADGQAFGGGRLMLLSADSVVKVGRRPRPSMFVIAHEIGHTLAWPHSYGGNTEFRPPTDSVWNPTDKWTAQINEYDNPMDLMSGAPTSQANVATIAVNRYAAGWIDPEDVRIHDEGDAEYELAVPGVDGIQMLVIPTTRTGRFYTIGARLGLGLDIAVPRQGVEVYKVDQTTSVSGRYTGGLGTRIQPHPPEPANASPSNIHMTDHVYRVGDTFEVGRFVLEVVERTAKGFVVRVSDPRAPVVEPDPGPDYVGRFSDDDGSVHEENIEVIAELGITVGCNPPDNDRYCPRRVVTRAQMMAFLSRALGGSGTGVSGPSRFSDVADSAWYRTDLEWMAELGVVMPYEDGTFRPDEPLTRLDMAVFLVRAFDGIGVVADPEGVFSDVAADADGAGEVEGVLAAGVTSGCFTDPLRYCPTDPVRRDQMASFLVKALATQTTATSSPDF